MYYFRFTKQQQKVLMEILKSDEITFKFSFSSNYFILENQLDIQNCFDYILDYFICNGLLKNDGYVGSYASCYNNGFSRYTGGTEV